MDGAKRDLAEPVELVRSHLGGAWLLVVPALLSLVAVIFIGSSPTLKLLVAVGLVGAFGLSIFVLRWASGRNAIFADPRGLIAVVRGRAARAAEWEEIREAWWYGGSLWLGWEPGGIVVTTEEGKFQVGSIVIVGRRRRAEVVDHVLTYLAARLGHERVTQ